MHKSKVDPSRMIYSEDEVLFPLYKEFARISIHQPNG